VGLETGPFDVVEAIEHLGAQDGVDVVAGACHAHHHALPVGVS
jgi:hypothetical protein